ncbi:MAG: hypothetical protein HKN47_06225 [Pirellulaceae bacterium]|nr:hypothetical protein [Pirellulaceae bacterium]
MHSSPSSIDDIVRVTSQPIHFPFSAATALNTPTPKTTDPHRSAGDKSSDPVNGGGTDRDPDCSSVTFRQYRAPREHGETFVDPAWDSAGSLLAANRRVLDGHDSHWATMRQAARQQMIADAIRYTSVYRDTSWVKRGDDRPIIMAGHQPSLFHPGVWFKNFALSYLADQHGATAVNLVVDNDVAKSSAIRVPTTDPVTGLTQLRTVAYDNAGGGVPYEQTTVRDLERFDQFDAEVRQTIEPLVSDPCVGELWAHARAAIGRCGVAGCALAQARHALEGDVGLQTLEVPLSVVCRGNVFAEFALSILTELPRFQRCYNDSAQEYRRVHSIRSTAHPVPDLAQSDGWFEAPLWIYGNQSPGRKAAWARLVDDHLEISDLGNRLIRIDTRSLSGAIDQLSAAMTPEFKIRPRALLTTMYSRLILSDLFLHGIGGGKYDQLGDMVTQAFFGVIPPQFMVLSATVNLPTVGASNDPSSDPATNSDSRELASQIRHVKRRIRETHFQGERFADQPTMDQELVATKRELLSRIPPRGSRQQWHIEITRVNRSLAQSLTVVRSTLESELAQLQRQAAAQTILESREHSFCLYPLEYLIKTFNGLLPSGR